MSALLALPAFLGLITSFLFLFPPASLIVGIPPAIVGGIIGERL